MTTREENLKKINDELEKLDDEQLEKVAGGLMPQNGLRGVAGGFRGLVYEQYQNTDTAQNTNNPVANQLGDRLK